MKASARERVTYDISLIKCRRRDRWMRALLAPLVLSVSALAGCGDAKPADRSVAGLEPESGMALIHAQSDDATAYLPLVLASADLRARDIVREPAIPTEWTADADFVLGGPAMAVDVEGHVAYVGIGAHLVAMDVSGDGEPVALGASPPLPGMIADVVVRGGIAYAAVSQLRVVLDDPGGLFVLDVTNPSEIVVIGVVPIVGGATELAVDGDRALVASAESPIEGLADPRFVGITLIDVSAPSTPWRVRRWSLGETRWPLDVEFAGSAGYFCDGHLHVIDLDHDAPPQMLEPPIACSVLLRFDVGPWMAVIADVRVEEPATLRMFSLRNPFSPALVAAAPLVGGEDWIDGLIVVDDATLDDTVEDVILLTGWSWDDGGFVGRLDLAAFPEVEREWTPLHENAGFGIEAHGGRAIVAAGVGMDGVDSTLWPIEFPVVQWLGSAVVIVPGGGEDSAEASVVRTGPGIRLSALVARDDRAYALESWSEEEPRVLWGFDLSTAYPTALGSSVLDGEFSFHDLFVGSWTAMTEGGVFITNGESTTYVFDVRGGAPLAAGDIPFGGLIAAEGESLFVMTRDGQFLSFDTTDPAEPALRSTTVIPKHDWFSAAIDDGRLWLVSRETFDAEAVSAGVDRRFAAGQGDSEHLLIDVSDPERPNVLGALPNRIGDGIRLEDLRLWRVAADGHLANVLAFESTRSRNEVLTFRAPAGGGSPEFVRRRPFGPLDDAQNYLLPFASTLWRDRLWFTTRPWVDDNERTRLFSLDMGEPGGELYDDLHAMASAARAMQAFPHDEPAFHVGAVEFTTAGDRLLVSDVEGGLMGFSKAPRRSSLRLHGGPDFGMDLGDDRGRDRWADPAGTHP